MTAWADAGPPADYMLHRPSSGRTSTHVTDAIQLTRLPSGLTVVTERMDRVETVSFLAHLGILSRRR